jgi:tetratricopeptide (TPR) repeat protein
MRKKLLLILTAVMLASCSQPTTSPTTTSESTGRLGERIESGAGYRQDEEGVVVVHLRGSVAEMRSQYRTLLADEIAGFRQAAANHRAMQELRGNCSNFAAFGPASADGKLWHAINFDLEGYGLLDRYRVVCIVEPTDKIPFVAISWAGYDPWGYPSGVHTAMNAQGLSVGQMASMAPGESFMDIPVLWRLFRQIMESASTIEEALAILEAGPRKGALNLLLTDGKVPDAVVVELTTDGLAVRPAEDGIVYATNHFVSQEMFYPENKSPNSYARFERLGDLGALHYGEFDLERATAVLRDRYDVLAGRETLSGDTVISYGNMLGVVFHPSDLTFWVANGPAPAAYHEFVGFSLRDELNGTQAQSTVPSVPADPIVGSEAWTEVEAFQAGARAFMQGDDSTAAERLAEAVSLNPRSALYGYGLASVLEGLGREEEALAAFEAALAGDSGSSTYAYIHYRLGLIYEAMGAEDEMHAAFEQVLALDVGDEEIEGYARQALGR